MKRTTYRNEADAETVMRSRNRACRRAGNYRDVSVLVKGPEDGEYTVMDLCEAIEHGFTYRWEA